MKKKGNAAIRITISFVLTNIVIIAIAGVLMLLGSFERLQTDFTFAHLMYSIVGVVTTALVFWVYKTMDKQSPWLLGFRMTKKDTGFSLLAIIVSFVTVSVFIWLMDRIGVVTASYHFDRMFTWNFYQLLGIAMIGWFLAALKEEVLARGYFMANLNRMNIPAAILVSSILFMALHFVMGDFDPFKAASWLKGGIVYAYIYVKSGSLTVSTIVHAAHNHVNDLVIHGNDGALVLLNTKLMTDDKLMYEFALSILLLLLTYLFYGKNGVFTPANNLKKLWDKSNS